MFSLYLYISFSAHYRCSTLRERSLEISCKIPIGKFGISTLGYYIGHTGLEKNKFFELSYQGCKYGVWVTRGIRVLYPYILSMFYSYIRYIF